MNNDELIEDLKQFITNTVSQATANLVTKEDLSKLEAKMDQQFAHVDERFDELNLKVDTIADAQAEDLDDHEQRISHLESTA